jgi:hypothetical protein
MPARKKMLVYEPDTTTAIPIGSLRLYQRNPRKGNVGAVAASLKAHGQYRPIVANIGTHTGRALEVLAGNHTLKAFRALAQKNPDDSAWSTVLVHLVDVDDDQAKRIVLADNKTSEGGSYDNAALSDLLGGLQDSLDGLGATGFTVDDLDTFSVADDVPDDHFVDAEGDPDPADAPSGRGAPVVSYAIVFDTTEQKAQWVEFMNWLRRDMPECTPGERITNYIEDQANASLTETEDL